MASGPYSQNHSASLKNRAVIEMKQDPLTGWFGPSPAAICLTTILFLLPSSKCSPSKISVKLNSAVTASNKITSTIRTVKRLVTKLGPTGTELILPEEEREVSRLVLNVEVANEALKTRAKELLSIRNISERGVCNGIAGPLTNLSIRVIELDKIGVSSIKNTRARTELRASMDDLNGRLSDIKTLDSCAPDNMASGGGCVPISDGCVRCPDGSIICVTD